MSLNDIDVPPALFKRIGYILGIWHSMAGPRQWLRKQFKPVTFNALKRSYKEIAYSIISGLKRLKRITPDSRLSRNPARKKKCRIMQRKVLRNICKRATIQHVNMSADSGLSKTTSKHPAIFLSWHAETARRAAPAAAKWAGAVKWRTFPTLYIKHPQGHREARKDE